MITIRFTENQVTECDYDFSELPNGMYVDRRIMRRTYWDNETDQLVTEITIERIK